MKRFLILIITLFAFQFSFSQDYKSVDAIVSKYPSKFNSIEQFSNRISNDFKTDIDKVRAVYYWISNHIEYDYKSYRDQKNDYKSINYESGLDYQDKLLSIQRKYAEKVFRKNTGVCEGYSQLLIFTLTELGIESVVITGYAKTSTGEIGHIVNTTNHAWNAVKIDNKWKLIDATWSTGNDEANPGSFNFSEEYFLIKPEKLILNHFPEDSKWQLLNPIITKENFFFKPLFYGPYFLSNLELKNNVNGIIKVKQGDSITLVFDKADTEKIYFYEFTGNTFSTQFSFNKVGNTYIAEIPFTSNKNSILTIFDSNFSLIDFKIIIER